MSETLVLAEEWPEVLARLSNATMPFDETKVSTETTFYGWVKADRFKFSLKTRRFNSFMPVITGTIEPTSNGCIIFIQYRFFPVTKMFLIFWSLFIAITGTAIAHQYKSVYFLLTSFGIVLFINWIAWANFNLQKKLSRNALLKILRY